MNCRIKKVIKVEMSSYIKGQVELRIQPKEGFKQLTNIYGPSTLPFMTVFSWMKTFKSGLSIIKDSYDTGWPKTPMTRKHMTAMKALVEDRIYMVDNIASRVGISKGNVYAILKKKSGLRKKCAQ